jgi:hypothetical protein
MAIDDARLFHNIYSRAATELLPKLKVQPKSASSLHLLINAILNLVYPKDRRNSYLENYSTTLGYTISIATGQGTTSFKNWQTLCHEIVHALDAKRWTRFVFGWFYLWPLSQGALLLLTCWLPIFWAGGRALAAWIFVWALVAGVHFIPQLPDPWRKHWELRGYTVSMHLRFLTEGKITANYIEQLVDNFHSMAYYIMAPNRGAISNALYKRADLIEKGESPVRDWPIVRIAEDEYARVKEADQC